VRQLLFFVFVCAFWAAADHFIAPPIARLIRLLRGGVPRFPPPGREPQVEVSGSEDHRGRSMARASATNLGIAELLVGISVGFVAGLLQGQVVLAVSFTVSAWSWLATLALIVASLVGAALRFVLELLLSPFALG